MLKSVITGSSGFIGRALIEKFKGNPKYEMSLIEHSVLQDPVKLKEILNFIQPDYIFHLSAFGNHSTQTDNTEIFNANVIGTFNLLEASKDIPYKAFINFGSSSEYGQKSTSMSELDLPEASTMYGCTKIAGTYLARAYAKTYNKPIVTVRPFSVFGEGEADHRFIPTVIRSLLKGEELKLDAWATHDWIYIVDFLDALGLVADNADTLSGQVINIGTGKEYTNEFILNALEIISKKEAKVKLINNMRLNDSKTWVADISKLKVFKWYPKYPITTALLKTFEYYRNKYNAN